MPSTVDLVKEN